MAAGELELAKGIRTTTNVELDAWYGPYASLSEARNAIPESMRLYRRIGVIQHGGIEEYCWKFGNGDNNLILNQGKTYIVENEQGIFFEETRSVPKGLEYSGDYRLTFSNRSLADWGNVISQLGGKPVDTTVTDPGAAEHGYCIAWNNTNLEYELKEVATRDSVFPISAPVGSIPFINATSSGFTYSNRLIWNNVTGSLLAAGNGSTISGINNFNLGLGTALTGSWSLTIAEQSIIRGGNAISSGWSHEVGDGINPFSGFGTITYGTDNKNYGNGSFCGGIGARVNYDGIQRGGLVVAFQTSSVNGKKPANVEYLTGNSGAFNVSRNTPLQIIGHGALGRDSAILAGVDGHIPLSSPRCVLLGGDGQKARENDPDQVYAPHFNITSVLSIDDSLPDMLVHDNATGQVKKRNANLLAGQAVDETMLSPTALHDKNAITWNQTNLEYELLPALTLTPGEQVQNTEDTTHYDYMLKVNIYGEDYYLLMARA
jgi:hypothetical protein